MRDMLEQKKAEKSAFFVAIPELVVENPPQPIWAATQIAQRF
jgi:hypothetical protein